MTPPRRRSARARRSAAESQPGVDREGGAVAIEAALTVPLLAMALLAALQTLGLVRTVLVAQEAARTGARVAATAADAGEASAAAIEALGGLSGRVTVAPRVRRPGDLVVVTVRSEVRLGPLRRPVTARSVAVVEPGIAPGLVLGRWTEPSGTADVRRDPVATADRAGAQGGRTGAQGGRAGAQGGRA